MAAMMAAMMAPPRVLEMNERTKPVPRRSGTGCAVGPDGL
jgi:hypothetical protein